MRIRLLLTIAGLAISFALPTFAQRKETMDPPIGHQIDPMGKLTEAINKDDAGAVAAVFTEDAVLVTPQGPIYGREAIENHYADVFQQFRLSNANILAERDSPHNIGTTGNETWENGE